MPKMSRVQEARDLINEALMTCVMDEAARALLRKAIRVLRRSKRKSAA